MSIRPSVRQSTSTRPSHHSLNQSMSTGPSTSKRHSFSLKKREKVSEFDTQKEIDNSNQIDLSKYCPQKIFNILFINETDELSNKIMKKIIEVSRKFEDISFLTFITYDEVVSLVENCDKAVLPTPVKSNLMDFLRTLNLEEDTTISTFSLARLMKIKLIEVMYAHYIKAVTKMQSRRKLMADLKVLTAECSPKEKGSKKGDSKPSTASKKTVAAAATPQTNLDYTNIPIETEDDIIFDDDIHHHISYYIFHGFYDPELLKELIVNNAVEIQAILKITAQSAEKSTDKISGFSNFWEQIYKNFDGPKRCPFLENTFLMTYNASGNDINHIFEELLYVIRSITDIKLNHLNYIRHTEIFRGKEIYNYFPLECFTVYNHFFQKFPMELVNIPILVDTLLKQVSVSVDEIYLESSSQHSYPDGISFEQNRCIDPCSIETFFKKKVKIGSTPSTLWKPITSFLAYENDELFITMNSYKKYGSVFYDSTMKMLKNTHPLNNLNDLEANCREIIHKHDIDPSTKTVIRDEDIVLHFLYLFLFNLFGHRNTLPKLVETDLTKNLETYNKLDFIKHCQTKLLPCGTEKEEDVEDNLYNIAPTEYFWKEELGPTMLLQQILKAQDEYLYYDYRFSPETDNLLIQYSNCLDDFGINTKIYDQYLPTLICLRDFCKYIAVQNAEWLEKNKPPKYVRKCVVREECPGVKKIADLNMFPEYSYLIETENQHDIEPDHQSNNENEITFDQLIEEIKHYPPNSKLIKECGKSEKQDKLLVYDFGTKYFQIKGAKTTFHSHDDVKLTIDNTILMDEYSKCSVCLDCRGNTLVLHTGRFYLKEDYSFHMNLADGTIVSFIFYKYRKSVKSKESVLFENGNTEKYMRETTEYDYTKYSSTVLSIDQNYFQNNVKINLLNEEYTSSTDIAFKPAESMLERLRKAACSNVPIYKINNNLIHVKKLKSEFEIPLTSIVKRILHNTISAVDGDTFTKRYLPIRGHRQQLQPTMLFDARLALSNGLYTSFYPSKLKKDLVEVKQEFLYRNASTELEEFRLFARGGYVLIKKIDGSITILKSNGDVVDHEKLDTDSENVSKWRTKPCHCKNIEDYRKRVCKLFKSQNEEILDIAVSRRACLQTKKGYAVSQQTTTMLKNSKIPYLKSSVMKFDGTRVCLESGKVRVKKALHVTFEKNFVKNEVRYERSDGFRSTIDRNGRQLVEFVDGTKITSIMRVAKDLVDGYVYISLDFEFQHPNYATVAYRSDSTLEISLNNAIITREADNIVLNIDKDITTTINKKRVLFEKICSKCQAKYSCNINIQPMVSGEMMSGEFIHACDSYNKHFYADFAGQCTRNQDYIKGQMNTVNCNHFSRMSYKKLFVVNRDLSGCTFWTDNMVSAKKAMSQETDGDGFDEFNNVTNSKILVYKFKKDVYNLYSNRFLNKSVIENPKDQPAYSTFCVVKRMVDTKTIENFCQDLLNYFRRAGNANSGHSKILEKMFKDNETYHRKENEMLMKAKAKVVEKEKCKCVKERISIREKIERWRRECEKYRALIRSSELPCYFKSPFCKIITKE